MNICTRFSSQLDCIFLHIYRSEERLKWMLWPKHILCPEYFFRQLLKPLHGDVNRNQSELVHSATGTAVDREIRGARNQF
jgi:hypothetical protein